jgi:hypothetical protein
MHNILYIIKLVMSLINKVPKSPNISSPISQHELNAEELELLLLLIKQSTFIGKDVEKVYNTTLKLQNQYLKQNK